MEDLFLYYDEQDVLSYFVGTYSEFNKMIRSNPGFTKA